MHDEKTSGELLMRWVPVVDERGRTRMETCWVLLGGPVTAPVAASVTHAA
ncbi:MAG: hypothetical protein WKF79_09780 [Nocardioides sp.]